MNVLSTATVMFRSPASFEMAAMSVTFMVDRKSTRLNSSHSQISYAVFCLKKKKQRRPERHRPERGARRRNPPQPQIGCSVVRKGRVAQSAISCWRSDALVHEQPAAQHWRA